MTDGMNRLYRSGVVALTAAVFALELATPLGLVEWVLYVPICLAGTWYSGMRFAVILGVLCSMLIGAGLFLSPPGAAFSAALANRTVGLAALWLAIATVHILKRSMQLDASVMTLRAEVRWREEAEGALRRAHATLEDKVRERTADLARLNATLRESEERLRAVVETAVEGIITIDEGGLVQSINPAALAMFGYAPEELIGQNVNLLMDSPERERHDGYIANYLRTGKAKIIGIGREVGARRKNGESFPIELSVTQVIVRGQRQFAGFVRDISARKNAADALRASHARLRELYGHLQSVRDDEQKRIARELHDELGSALTAVQVNLDALLNHPAAATQAFPRELIVQVQTLLDRVIGSMHRIVSELRPGVIDELGVWSALETLAREAERDFRLHCTIDLPPAEAKLPPALSMGLYRIAQEALNNAAKHAEASSVHIRAALHRDVVLLEIVDDGKGMPGGAHTNKAWGLLGMQERAASLGGEVRIESAPQRGTRVHVRLPLEREPAAHAVLDASR